MKNEQMRSVIPISAPATWEPCTGTESFLRPVMGFCPSELVRMTGKTFGKRWHTDCVYRYDVLLTMKKELYRRFPEYGDYAPKVNSKGYDEDCATLSGVYGIKLIPMLYGQQIIFPDDDWPQDAASGNVLSEESLRKLKPFDIQNHPVIESLLLQMDEMEHQFGRINGLLNYQGILNVAFKLRGADIFIDMLEDEAFADDLFAHIANTITETATLIQHRQRQSGVDMDQLAASNCVVNMIAPAMYERFLLPLEQKQCSRFKRYGIHTCNWNVTPYLDQLTRHDNIGYLDMGFCSDLAKVREKLPYTRCNVFYSVRDLAEKPLESLRIDMERIAKELGPCDVTFADLMNVNENRIHEVLGCVDLINKQRRMQ